MATPITRELGEFVARLRFDDLPAGAAKLANTAFIDCVGVILAGRNEAAPQTVLKGLAPPAGESTLLFSPRTAPALEAAHVNGTAGHVLDFDDVAMRAHPSTCMIPAILAEGEALRSTGRRMLTAYVAGYEAWAELMRRDAHQHSLKGWHPTGIFGPIAAAAACASLRGLDAAATTNALAISASQSAGLMANFGTMTKSFHAGQAARAGVFSARLAACGMDGAPDAFEHPRGFLAAVSPEGRVDFDSPCEAGRDWKITRYGIHVKKYGACYCTHKAIDGMLGLVAKHRPDPEAVASITVTMSRRNALILRHHRPQTGLEGKFSIEFTMAGALVAGRMGLAEFADDFVRRPEVQRLMEKVEVDIDPREDPLNGYAPFDRVVVKMRSGETLDSGPVEVARGAYSDPLAPAELKAKFMDCAAAGGAGADAAGLFDAVANLEHRDNSQWIRQWSTQ